MTSGDPLSVADANGLRLGARVRNDRLLDIWSASHVVWGVVLAILLGPFWAIAILIAWEPFEIFLLGPALARWGVSFGHETWRNSLSDMVFDAAGAAIAFFFILGHWDPMGVV